MTPTLESSEPTVWQMYVQPKSLSTLEDELKYGEKEFCPKNIQVEIHMEQLLIQSHKTVNLD